MQLIIRILFTQVLYFWAMRTSSWLLIGGILLAQTGQTVKAVFGLLEGTSTLGGGFYSLIQDPYGARSIMVGPLFHNGGPYEPYGNDLAYDRSTKYLFLTGGGPNPFTYKGVVYAMDVWNAYLLDSLTGPIGARRLAVKDTLLLVTRNQLPFFTAYRIRPTANGVALDSLWSPSSPYLRSVPEAIVVVGDTAFIPLTYDPNNFSPDSLILSINLRTMQVDSFAKVYPNPAELVRIGSKLYAACYGDFTVPLHISEVDIPTRNVTITNTTVISFGGFAADTGGRDTILFVDAANSLRAYDITTQQVAASAYQGIQGLGNLSLYGLLWVGDWLVTGHTNYTDTLIVVLKDRGLPFGDTTRTSIPSLRRLIYVEEDATILELAHNREASWRLVQAYPNPVMERFYLRGEGIRRVVLRDLGGRCLRTWENQTLGYEVLDVPSGVYILQVETSRGVENLRLQKL